MGWFARWRERARLERAARAEVDALFADAGLLDQARLKPRHRHRINVLEIDAAPDGRVARLVLGIVRHPRAHPLATRGDEVVEILEYLPAERRVTVIGARNLSRNPASRG